MFSEVELNYLKSQFLARLATVSHEGQPTVDAVGFEFDGARFYISGMALPGTRKYKNIANGNRKVSLIIDDLESVNPWKVRGIKIHGLAEIVERAGQFGQKEYLSITPSVSWSWGFGGEIFRDGKFVPKKIIWAGNEI